MGLFKKKKKQENIQEVKVEVNSVAANIEPSSVSDITSDKLHDTPETVLNPKPETKVEILDFEDKGKKIKTEIERKNDFKFLIILFGIVIVFVFSMPTIRNIFIPKPKIETSNTSKTESDSGNLEHGYLVINKDSYKKVENIKFFDFKKYENSNIVFNYISNKDIKNSGKLNIYIEVVDNAGTILHEEKFSVSTKIKSDAEYSYSINLSKSMYENAYYIKIETSELVNYTKTLVCKMDETTEEVKTSSEITYTFTDNMLISYIYNESYEMIDSSADSSSYSSKYKEQYDILKKTNIKKDDIEYTKNSIYYKIDFSYFDLSDIEFETRYAKYDYYTAIEKYERQKGWTCE